MVHRQRRQSPDADRARRLRGGACRPARAWLARGAVESAWRLQRTRPAAGAHQRPPGAAVPFAALPARRGDGRDRADVYGDVMTQTAELFAKREIVVDVPTAREVRSVVPGDPQGKGRHRSFPLMRNGKPVVGPGGRPVIIQATP